MIPLNADVLIDNVFPYLSFQDLENLGRTCRSLYQLTNDPNTWHDLYQRTFGVQPNALTAHQWPELYKLRSLASLYTWGGAGNGRLGYHIAEISSAYLTQGGTATGCCHPKRVDRLGTKSIADLVAGGFSFTILTVQGELFGIGDINGNGPRPIAVPIRALPANTTANTNVLGSHQGRPVTGMPGIAIPSFLNPRHPRTLRPRAPRAPRYIQMSIDDCVEPKSLLPHLQYCSVSSGRKHVVALTIDGDIYVWGETFALAGVKVKFSFPTTKDSVKRVVAGWNSTVALISGVGLVVWHSELHANDQSEEATETEVTHSVVPGTVPGPDNDLSIIDIVAGESFLVYLTQAGRVYYVSLKDVSSRNPTSLVAEPLTELMDQIAQNFGENARCVKLSGSFRKLAVLTSTDNVLIAQWDDQHNRFDYVIKEQLQKVGCVSVATGDHHLLALLSGGKLLSWGCEPQSCGCLGQGTATDIESRGGRTRNYDLVLDDPTPIFIRERERALVIAAAGWQSAAIYAEVDDDGDEDIF